MSEWTAVSDKLPDYCETVLIWCEGMMPTAAYRKEAMGDWVVNDWDDYESYISFRDVTHWREMVKVPSGRKKEIIGAFRDWAASKAFDMGDITYFDFLRVVKNHLDQKL